MGPPSADYDKVGNQSLVGSEQVFEFIGDPLWYGSTCMACLTVCGVATHRLQWLKLRGWRPAAVAGAAALCVQYLMFRPPTHYASDLFGLLVSLGMVMVVALWAESAFYAPDPND
jgi:hypothetical protein